MLRDHDPILADLGTDMMDIRLHFGEQGLRNTFGGRMRHAAWFTQWLCSVVKNKLKKDPMTCP